MVREWEMDRKGAEEEVYGKPQGIGANKDIKQTHDRAPIFKVHPKSGSVITVSLYYATCT
jgi:hypothetical protein